MTSRQQEQRPYGLYTEHSQQYYNHAQASQFSLHTPTDPNPPNSSFRSPPGSPPHHQAQFLPPSPGFVHMERQQTPTSTTNRPLTRVFDGEESLNEYEFSQNSQAHEHLPVEYGQDHEQHLPVEYEHHLPVEYGQDNGQHLPAEYGQDNGQHLPAEYGQDHGQHLPAEYGQDHEQQQYQGFPQQYQGGHEQHPTTEYHEQYQDREAEYQHQSTEYSHQNQGYGNQVHQRRYSAPPPSQFDSQSKVNAKFSRRISEQYGPSPQYASPPHTPSFPPPPKSSTFPPSLVFPPPPRSPTFPPPPTSPIFPPPPRSPAFPPPPTSPIYPPQSSVYVPYTPHTPTFPPPPTSEFYQAMNADTSSPPPDLELEIVPHPQQRHPVPPEPIGTPAYKPGDPGPKTPIYTPGGGSGPNGGVHAPGQIGHPNQQYGKEIYHHGLCDCFSDMSSCCMGYWCPCILYSRTNHRLKTSPNSNLNDFHSCNGHCMMFCALAPLSWIFTTLQRSRVREKYRLEGTVASDCGKAYCCVMCTLVQDDREVTDREDERRRFAGPGTGVAGNAGYKRETMIYERQQ